MPLTDAEFRIQLLAADDAGLVALVNDEMLDRQPTCFDADPSVYDQLRAHLAKALKTTPDSVYLVGSASLGYSTAPDGFPRKFHDLSDLDFAVVSPSLFDESWMHLLGWGHVHKPVFPPEDEKWFVQRQREIFWGWFPQYLPRFTGVNRPELLRGHAGIRLQMFETFQSLGKNFPGTQVESHPNHGRLYRSRDHLVRYHVDGLRRLQERLIEGDSNNGI